jgi:uncharacterized protein YkwD
MENQANVEKELRTLINLVRKEPKWIIKKLKEYSSSFAFDTLSTGWGEQIQTTEGKAAVEEAIEFLEK